MITSQENLKIKELIKNGYSISYIARYMDRSLTTIYRIRDSQTSKNNDRVKELTTIPRRLHEFTQFIQKRKSQGVMRVKKIYRELQKEGYKGNYMEVYRYMKLIANVKRGKEKKFVKRYETQPGEQAQVDWGSFGKIKIKDKTERLYAFAYTLGYSRMKYIEFTVRQNLQTFLNCHIHALEQLGTPKVILYDNMKTVVLKRDRNNNLKPIYNTEFQDFAKHYAFQIMLAYPYWPRGKGKVEAVIKNIRNDFMEGMKFGRDFFSLEELNKKVSYWLDAEVHRRIHRSTGEMPFLRFELEKKHLRFPDTSKHYKTSFSSVRYVTKYAMVQYKCNSYSVPEDFARKKVIVEERSDHGLGKIDIYFQNKIIATHELVSGRNKWIQKEEHFKINNKKSLKVKRSSKKQKENEKIIHGVSAKPLSYYDRFLRERAV
ncbi:IS21 family transposase [Candidatus Microgenomates bacterium]|nr:IS21 family transposase [Candidatus Microgenomates bacterium]